MLFIDKYDNDKKIKYILNLQLKIIPYNNNDSKRHY